MKRTQKSPKEIEVQELIQKKKPAKAASKKKTEKIIAMDDLEVDDMEDSTGTTIPEMQASSNMRKYLVIALVIGLIGWLGFRYSYLFVPATVNGQPIYAWEYFVNLHKQYGVEYLNTLTTQKVIEQAIVKANVTVESSEIDKEIDAIDKRASSSGGISALLSSQNLTMDQLREQVRIQLAVKQILKDKIAVSDSEVDDAYKKNKDFFKGRTEAEAKASIKEQLESQKFQKEASTWVSDERTKAAINIRLPGAQVE